MAKRRKDINETAFDIVNELTGDEPPKEERKSPLRKKQTSRLTPEERRENAKKAAAVRWGKKSKK